MSGMDDWNTKPGTARPIVTKLTAAATLTPAQQLIEVAVDGGANFTITLPPLAMLPHGHVITFVAQGDANDADVTIAAHGIGALDGDGVEFGAFSPVSVMEDGEILTVMAVYGQRWIIIEDTTKGATKTFTEAVTFSSSVTVAGATTCSGVLNAVGATSLANSSILMAGLPTTDPSVAGRLWLMSSLYVVASAG